MAVLKIATTIALAIIGLMMAISAASNINRANIRLFSFTIATVQVLAIAFMWQ